MEKTKRKVGRPTVDTEITRRKIEEATALDASIEEVCFFADIHKDTYYEIIKKDKEFSDRLQALRNNPVLKARQTVNAKMAESYQNAMDYLRRKRKLEFGDNVDVTSGGKPIPLFDNVTTHAIPNNNINNEDTTTQ